MTFSGIHSGGPFIFLVIAIIIFTINNYLNLNEENVDSKYGQEKPRKHQDRINIRHQDGDSNKDCSCHKKITLIYFDSFKCYKREICNSDNEKYMFLTNWTCLNLYSKYVSLMEGIYSSGPPFQLCREVVVFPLFGSNSLDYEWRLASFRDPEFWYLDLSALELAEEGLKWEETEKIVVCCQCCNSLTPNDIKRGESRHMQSCPFKRHRAQQTDVEDDHHVNCVRYLLRSGQPSVQNIFYWMADASNPEDTIPGNDYDIFVRHPNSVIEEPFIHVNPDMINDPLPHLRNYPERRHISNPIRGSSTDLLSGSDVIPGSNDETGLDEATGGAPPEE